MMMSSRRSKSLNLRKRGNANKAVQQENFAHLHTRTVQHNMYLFKNEENGCICLIVTNRGKEARNTVVIGPEGTI